MRSAFAMEEQDEEQNYEEERGNGRRSGRKGQGRKIIAVVTLLLVNYLFRIQPSGIWKYKKRKEGTTLWKGERKKTQVVQEE